MATGKIIASQEVLHNLAEHCYDQFENHKNQDQFDKAKQFQFMHQFLEHISKEVSENKPTSRLIIEGGRT